VGHGPDGKR
jgi:hypothetical protein